MKAQKIEISYKTIIFTVFFLLGLFVVWQLRSLFLLVFVCYLLTEGLNPAVSWLERHKIIRPLAIVLLYLLILAIIGVVVAGLIPALVEQTENLVKNLPAFLNNFSFLGINGNNLNEQFKILEKLPPSIASTVVSVFSNVFSMFIILVITFYLLMDRKNFDNYLVRAFGSKSPKAIKVLHNLQKTLGSWVNAELLLMLFIGLLSYIGYLVIGVNYALPLAIIAGILEVVPSIGPTIASILAGIFGLTVSPLTAVLAVIWGIIIQQIEGNFIVPKVMKETVGLHPLVTILTIFAGAKLGGIIGALIAVPLFLTFQTIYKTIRQK